jgi:lipopolysaccharide/colanic/teichoic acid biosynthesis glycosyltransferase
MYARAVYLDEILPQKMKYNLEGIAKFGITNEMKLLFMTVFAILGKDYSDEALKSEKITEKV